LERVKALARSGAVRPRYLRGTEAWSIVRYPAGRRCPIAFFDVPRDEDISPEARQWLDDLFTTVANTALREDW